MHKFLLLFVTFTGVANAAGGGMNYINQSINLLIFIGLIIFFARKPIMKMVRDRARGIRNDIEDSQNMLQKAESDFSSINDKLSSIETHIEALRNEAERDAVKLKEEMKVRGAAEAKRIVATAEQSIEEQLRRAKRELQAEAVEAAVELATQHIKQNLNDADQQRFNAEFVNSLKQEGGSNV
ncbi:MAG: ATP synthase F0 subunit B [Myxococcota bacterium]|nr:ATP synthase F0 subunit B [Myxococcota bacterium]MEC8379438.1 ATP synthase F0 subunit B [Myxococcota bacterium]